MGLVGWLMPDDGIIVRYLC